MNERMTQAFKAASEKSQAAAKLRDAHKAEILESVTSIHGSPVALALGAASDLFESQTSIIQAAGVFLPKEAMDKLCSASQAAHANIYSTMTALAMTVQASAKVMSEAGLEPPMPSDEENEKQVVEIGVLRDRLMDRQLDYLNTMRGITDELEATLNANKE